MLDDIARTAREQYSLRTVLGFVAAVVIVYGVTNNGGLVLGIATAFVVSEGLSLLRQTPGIDGRWAGVGTGIFVTGLSLVWFGYEYAVPNADGPLWFPLLTAAVGGWFLLDARKDFVEGRRRDAPAPADDMSSSEAMLVMNHAHLVGQALESGPKTVPELAEACDLTESRVREAIDVVGEDGTIHPVETDATDGPTRYAIDESKLGAVAFVRSIVGPAARRLVRPFRA